MTKWPEISLKTMPDGFEVVEDCYIRQFGIIITAGTKTNLTSSTRWFSWFIPTEGKTKSASIAHDFFIHSGMKSDEADGRFYLLLLECVKKWQAILMLFAISIVPKKFRTKIENKL